MKVFAAAFGTETNTFSAWPTGRRDFEEAGVSRGQARLDPDRMESMVLGRFEDLARADGYAFSEGLLAFAHPSGPTLQSVYESYRDEILAMLTSEGPFDIVLLLLHGAMVSTECDDCEGDLIRRIRAVVGPQAAIGAELDPHCHLTPMMVENADALVLMKEYPHDDFIPAADALYDICARKARGEVKPASAVFDCRMVGFYPTTAEPMAGLLRQMCEAERRPGVLSVSFAHGFPWGDTPETGSKVLVIADDDPALAKEVAQEIGLAIYDRRDALLPRYPDIETALDIAARCDGLCVLADTADNPGGGAPSDNTSLLRAMLDRDLDNAAIGPIWDPIAAGVCAGAGVGARFALRLGGKSGPTSADPLDLLATVKAIAPNHAQTGLGGSSDPLGLTVWVQVGRGVDVVISSIRTQGFHADLFTGLGIDLTGRRTVGVKSSHHFHTGFAPIADQIVSVATPGAIGMDFASLAYRRKRDGDFHPRVADPLNRDLNRDAKPHTPSN